MHTILRALRLILYLLLITTVSQKFDKTYMEQRELQAQKIENTLRILKSNSVDFNPAQQWSETEKQQNNDKEDSSVSSRDFNIHGSASI